MANCNSLIASAIDSKCLATQRFYEEAVILNRADVNWLMDVSGRMQLSVKAGKSGYKVTQPRKNPFTGSSKTANVGTYVNTIDKTVQLLVNLEDFKAASAPGNYPSATNVMDDLLNGEFVVVLRLADMPLTGNGGSSEAGLHRYEIMGVDTGAVVTEATAEAYNADTLGNWLVTLTETAAPVATHYAQILSNGPGTDLIADQNAASDAWFASLT